MKEQVIDGFQILFTHAKKINLIPIVQKMLLLLCCSVIEILKNMFIFLIVCLGNDIQLALTAMFLATVSKRCAKPCVS